MWKESGLLRRYDVWLNPALIGWVGAAVNIRVDHPRVKSTLFSRLEMVDGAVMAMEFLGEWVTLALVAPDPASLERRVALVRGLAGVKEVEPPILWPVLEPRRALTPLDIRIVRALRERPTATLSEAAHAVGISTRTMTRRYSALIDGWAVWLVRDTTVPVISLFVPHALLGNFCARGLFWPSRSPRFSSTRSGIFTSSGFRNI